MRPSDLPIDVAQRIDSLCKDYGFESATTELFSRLRSKKSEMGEEVQWLRETWLAMVAYVQAAERESGVMV